MEPRDRSSGRIIPVRCVLMATILLVEDDEGHQVLVEKMLRSGGHQVLTAPNGHEALRLLRAHQFEAVVTDLRMPLMNGLRLIR